MARPKNLRTKKDVKERTVKAFRDRPEPEPIPAEVNEIVLAERRYQVINKRALGFSVRDIATELQIPEHIVNADINFVLDETLKHSTLPADKERVLQADRLDRLTKTMMPYATESHKEIRTVLGPMGPTEVIVEVPPDPKFVKAVLDVDTRRAKLLGLDMPELKEVKVSGIREYRGVDYDAI